MTTWLEKQGYASHKYRQSNLTFLKIDEELICPVCTSNKKDWHVHHVLPVNRGGSNKKENLVLICTKCHQQVHYGDTEERIFAQKMIFNFMYSRYGENFELMEKWKKWIEDKHKTSGKISGVSPSVIIFDDYLGLCR